MGSPHFIWFCAFVGVCEDWGGKFSIGQCQAKCNAMKGRCQGITMKQGQIKCREVEQDDHKRKRKPTNEGRYSGTGWCETFHTCLKGDGRNFWAWVKATDFERFKGACAESNGRYGKRHKYWHGKFTFKQCKAKCTAMGDRCGGITMPTS